MIPVAKPKLPTADKLLPYLLKIDQNRFYSNFGPLVSELETAAAQHFRIHRDHVVTATNATLALTATIRAITKDRGGRCLLPSWTFCASAHAVVAAGLEPVFADIDPLSWQLTPEIAAQTLREWDIAAVMVVAPFGAPVPIDQWEEFSSIYRVPVIVDAAAAFANQQPGEIPCVFSLHATKTLCAGEGSLIVCGDSDLISDIRRLTNFDFLGERIAHRPAINAKMSEYAAAVALASLSEWPETEKQWALRKARYWQQLQAIDDRIYSPAKDAVTSTLVCSLPWRSEPIMSELARQGIDSRRWYDNGCHRQPAFSDYDCTPLPVTEHISEHVIGLPLFLDLTEDEIATVIYKLRSAIRRSSRDGSYTSSEIDRKVKLCAFRGLVQLGGLEPPTS